jgi:arsenate reductase (thioredoxin)
MAAALANHYGADVLHAFSAGISPTSAVPRNTVLAMREMNIDVSGHLPRLYNLREAASCDIVVNMSGYPLPGPPPKELIVWHVGDPMGLPLERFRAARADLENRVMNLILDLRRRARRK